MAYPKEKQSSCIFRIRDSVTNWRKAPREVRLLATLGTGRLEHSWDVYFKIWLPGPGKAPDCRLTKDYLAIMKLFVYLKGINKEIVKEKKGKKKQDGGGSSSLVFLFPSF